MRVWPLPPGAILALAGSALLALSTVLAWAVQPFFGSDIQQGLYPSGISLPRLILGGTAGDQPRLGLVLTLLAIGAAFLLVAGPTRRSFDLVRRGLGVAVVAVAVLFFVRFGQAAEGAPEAFQLPGGLRAGFYVGLAGGLVTILTGRPLRSR
jgi:hypothetical protein